MQRRREVFTITGSLVIMRRFHLSWMLAMYEQQDHPRSRIGNALRSLK